MADDSSQDKAPAFSTGDDWWTAVYTLTGYQPPKRGVIFEQLYGNDDIPLMKIEIHDWDVEPDLAELSAIDAMSWRTQNSGWRIENTDFVVPFFNGPTSKGSTVQMRKARITLLGTYGGEVPAGGVVMGGEFTEKGSHLMPDGFQGWDSRPLSQYSYGGGMALEQLLYSPNSTWRYAWNNVHVEDDAAVDLTGFDRVANAFDRAAQFFHNSRNTIQGWEDEVGTTEDAAWQGQAAGVFWDIIHQLGNIYQKYTDTLPLQGYSSKAGNDLRTAKQGVYNAMSNLHSTWSTWALYTGNPLRWLHDILLEVTDDIWDNNLVKVSAIPYVSEYATTWSNEVSEDGFRTSVNNKNGGSYGDLNDLTTWKNIGEEAIKRWQQSVIDQLGTAGDKAMTAVHNALVDVNKTLNKLTTQSINLQSDYQADKAAAEQAKADKAAADAAAHEKEMEDKAAADAAAAAAHEKEMEDKADKQRADDLAHQKEMEDKADKQRADDLAHQKEMEDKAEKEREEQEKEQKEQQAKQEQEQKEQEAKQEQLQKEQEAKQEQLQKEQEAKQEEQEKKQEEQQKEQEAKQEQQYKEQMAIQMAMQQQQEKKQEEQEKKQEQAQKEQEQQQKEQEARQEQLQKEQEAKQEKLQQEQEAKQEKLQKEQETKQEEQQKKQEEQQKKQEEQAQQQYKDQQKTEAEYQKKQEEQAKQQYDQQRKDQQDQEAKQEQLQKEQQQQAEKQYAQQKQDQEAQAKQQYEQQKQLQQQYNQQLPGGGNNSQQQLQHQLQQQQDQFQHQLENAYGSNQVGSQTHLNPDGTVTTDFSDGSSTTINPHTGMETTTHPNGSVTTEHLSHAHTLTNPDGSTSTVNSDGTITTHYPDGSVTTVNPRTSMATTHEPDGQTITTSLGNGATLPHGSSLGTSSLYEPELHDQPFDGSLGSATQMATESAVPGSTVSPSGNVLPLGTRIDGTTTGGTPLADQTTSRGPMGGPMGGMGGMGGLGGMGGGGDKSSGERVRQVYEDDDIVPSSGGSLGRRSRRPTEEETVAGRRTPTTAGYDPYGGGDRERTESGDREREAWVPEEEDVWGTDEGGSPAVIG
ncbi:AAWKG family protein [Actinoallomurus acaciae]|uniref:AAWKG family protein n=1 Tax=Actinoallomurus acaciae TaxID=502577 RepID=A0ABV5Y7W3_9ACTN